VHLILNPSTVRGGCDDIADRAPVTGLSGGMALGSNCVLLTTASTSLNVQHLFGGKEGLHLQFVHPALLHAFYSNSSLCEVILKENFLGTFFRLQKKINGRLKPRKSCLTF
jgi:hypothetical protein